MSARDDIMSLLDGIRNVSLEDDGKLDPKIAKEIDKVVEDTIEEGFEQSKKEHGDVNDDLDVELPDGPVGGDEGGPITLEHFVFKNRTIEAIAHPTKTKRYTIRLTSGFKKKLANFYDVINMEEYIRNNPKVDRDIVLEDMAAMIDGEVSLLKAKMTSYPSENNTKLLEGIIEESNKYSESSLLDSIKDTLEILNREKSNVDKVINYKDSLTDAFTKLRQTITSSFRVMVTRRYDEEDNEPFFIDLLNSSMSSLSIYDFSRTQYKKFDEGNLDGMLSDLLKEESLDIISDINKTGGNTQPWDHSILKTKDIVMKMFLELCDAIDVYRDILSRYTELVNGHIEDSYVDKPKLHLTSIERDIRNVLENLNYINKFGSLIETGFIDKFVELYSFLLDCQ